MRLTPVLDPALARPGWISTYSGLPFWPLTPRPEDVRLADIAHALANLCRFAGHVRRFYSVAQHSVLVSQLCDPPDALWGLLHDASEAYLSDVVSPVKRTPGLDGYRDIEARVQRAVMTRFGLPPDEPKSVKAADQVLLKTEQRDLIAMPEGWQPSQVAFVHRLVPLEPREAERAFLLRYQELTAR